MNENYTHEEKVELIKDQIEGLLSNSGLTVQTLYMIFNEYTQKLEKEYNQYKRFLIKSIQDKMSAEKESDVEN